jgi:hypothetical protein
MYNFFNITIANDVDSYILKYELYNHRPAQVWAEIINQLPVEYLRPNKSPWLGISKPIEPILEELENLVKELNQWMPVPIVLDWDRSNNQEMVNKYHTHFPEHKDDQDQVHRRQLTRYNDIIHDIENQIRLTNNSVYLLVCPDPSPGMDITHKVPLELEDYNLFTTNLKFGELYMGYSHIGRHPIELYHANDRDVPTDQILPQNVIGPIYYLYFHNYNINMEKFNMFYQNSGISWPYPLEDPRLALGLIGMGKLRTINGNELTGDSVLEIVKSCNKIVFWNVE